MIGAADAASRLNLDRTRRGWRGLCPACGYPGTFVLRAKEGQASGWCASCQDGPAIEGILAGLEGGGTVSAPPRPPDASTLTDAERTAKALAVWNGAMDAALALTAYCASRHLPGLERSPALRWRSDVRHPEERGLMPAMVAAVVDVSGQFIACHRTYLRRDGSGKADLSPNKASLGPLAGGAIRLDPSGPEIVIGEGIETAAAAGRILSLPAWAGVSAGNIERTMELPSEVRRVVIAADPDMPGQRAADGAARRWAAEGRGVRIVTPDNNMDFAELHAARVAGGGHG